jgi:hypothetical protein
MKKAMLILMLAATAVFGQNGVYVQKGKTTEVDFKTPHSFYSVKTTNAAEVVYFSNGLSSKVETNSELNVNSFIQEITNTNTNPEKAKFGPSTLNVGLMKGSAYFVYPEDDTNSSVVVSTPLADIEIHKGSYYFVVNEKNILVLVIDGSATAYGDKKDTKTVNAGNALIVMPNDVGILDSKISLSMQFIHEPVLNKLKASVKEISNLKNETLFIRINGKTIGVLIN